MGDEKGEGGVAMWKWKGKGEGGEATKEAAEVSFIVFVKYQIDRSKAPDLGRERDPAPSPLAQLRPVRRNSGPNSGRRVSLQGAKGKEAPENATFEAALDWLCLNLPGNELPLKFSSGTSLHSNGGGTVGIVSTAREDWSPPVDSSAGVDVEMPKASFKIKGRWEDDTLDSCQSSQADLIHQYVEQQEEVLLLNVLAKMKLKRGKLMQLIKGSKQQAAEPRSSDSILKEYNVAWLEAINAKHRGDKRAQEQAGQTIRKLKQAMSALGLSDNLSAWGYESHSSHAYGEACDSMPYKSPYAVDSCDAEGVMGSIMHDVELQVDRDILERCSPKEMSTEDIALSVPVQDANPLEQESGDVELGHFFLESASSDGLLPPEAVQIQKKENIGKLSTAKN
ncbi:hypothetical protein RJ639_037582 [Escallonia herrerae]|uniref:ATP-dependent RNA helicase DHX29-like UBA domain-containing protein n=1 Tax=Escallonia herrerae TaxID=1293975 RepID=A0AA88WJH2_9ASTE|nr:hypothetical protein RJ639_037582 [Escallonia herrerae]